MNGASVTPAANIAAADPGVWTLHGIGDYSGSDDILWRAACPASRRMDHHLKH
jgi:hypothetical protein